MPHQFQSINCKKCDYHYCPVCKEKCPKCGEIDIADEKNNGNKKTDARSYES